MSKKETLKYTAPTARLAQQLEEIVRTYLPDSDTSIHNKTFTFRSISDRVNALGLLSERLDERAAVSQLVKTVQIIPLDALLQLAGVVDKKGNPLHVVFDEVPYGDAEDTLLSASSTICMLEHEHPDEWTAQQVNDAIHYLGLVPEGTLISLGC